MPKFTLPLASGVALALGACSLVPTYERPPAPVAATYPDAATTAGAATTVAADMDWQTYFVDERLRRLIAIALDNNRDLRTAVLNVERAQAQYRIQGAARLPALNAVFNAQRQSVPPQLYTLGVGVTSWEIDFFGRIQSLKDAALAQYLSTAEARKAAQISLVAAVANGYLGLLADDELLRLTRETLTSREQSLKLVQLRFDSGATSELDLRQAQGLVEAARAALAQLERQRALDRNALTLLLGQSPGDDLPSGRPFSEQAGLLAELPVGLPSELLTKRPDIRAAEQQLIAANANIGAARAAFYPRIALTTSVGLVSNDLNHLLTGNVGWTFVPQIVLPIFNAGANQANLDVARISRDLAVAQYEKAIQGAFREVADALAGRATLAEQLRASRAQVDAAQATVRLSRLRYTNGVASHLDLLDAERSLFATQQATVQLQLAQMQNQVLLYKALGGGWKD
ncbi:MAG: efflux transporter outer membrane subunit [Burkholderiales bacterium]|nr:efflux transporter outer membrane subunit [Burkholderiales bacterium]MCZ2134554.1 efflux transporter outer membrane subunit [Burkholderiales bacterium]